MLKQQIQSGATDALKQGNQEVSGVLRLVLSSLNSKEKGNRPELADKEKKEIEIIQKYLPEQLSSDELKKLIKESISNVGAKEMKDMGKVMADLSPKIKGKADNSI